MDLPDQVEVDLSLLLVVSKVNQVADSEALGPLALVDLKGDFADSDVDLLLLFENAFGNELTNLDSVNLIGLSVEIFDNVLKIHFQDLSQFFFSGFHV